MEWDIKIKKLCKDGRYCNMLLHAGGNNPLENEKLKIQKKVGRIAESMSQIGEYTGSSAQVEGLPLVSASLLQ